VISGGAIQLTPADFEQTGTAFFGTPVLTSGLSANFAVQMSGGTGGDGFTFALVDAAKGAPTGVGASGAGLGFSGLPGLAVVGGTSWNSQLGHDNFLCVADGPGDGGQDVDCLAGAKVPGGGWGTGAHSLGVTVAGGTVKVVLDGANLLSYSPAAGVLPASAYVGFTAATGATYNVQVVSGVRITAKP
jgi:hypothetical protein